MNYFYFALFLLLLIVRESLSLECLTSEFPYLDEIF